MYKNNKEYKKLLSVLGIKKRNGRLWVVKQYGETSERKDEMIEVKPFVVEPAYVNYSEGVTLNVGNFQSIRIDVGITLPTYIEEIDSAYKKAKEIVDKQINEEIVKYKKTE